MALEIETNFLGMQAPNAYCRIDRLNLETIGGLLATFQYAYYASLKDYQAGIGAFRSGQFELNISSEMTPEMLQALQHLLSTFPPEQVATLAFALGRTVGYQAMSKQPEFEEAISV